MTSESGKAWRAANRERYRQNAREWRAEHWVSYRLREIGRQGTRREDKARYYRENRERVLAYMEAYRRARGVPPRKRLTEEERAARERVWRREGKRRRLLKLRAAAELLKELTGVEL